MIACKNCAAVNGGAARGTAECQMIDRTRRIQKYGLGSSYAGQEPVGCQMTDCTRRTGRCEPGNPGAAAMLLDCQSIDHNYDSTWPFRSTVLV